MSELFRYEIKDRAPSSISLYTSNLNETLKFYKTFGVNFIQDLNYVGTKFVAAVNSGLFFELYLSGDAKPSNQIIPFCLFVSDLEKKLAILEVAAQKQDDGSYALLDPDERVVHVRDLE